jgi:type IV secretion system protein VirB5
MIVRINDMGHAEAIDYRNFEYRPQEAENKYYLTRWAELYFSRNRFTVERDQTDSLYFLNSDVQRAVIDQERKDNIIQNYVKDSTLPYVDVEVKNVILDDLRQSPYSARIEFEKVYTNPADHSELKRERWTASVTYVFRENVKNNELAVNPLGLTIVRFRADQAFSFALACVCRYVSRLILGHRFGAFPAPCGARSSASRFHPSKPTPGLPGTPISAPLRGLGSSQNKFANHGTKRRANFFRAPPRKQTFGLGSRAHSLGFAQCDPSNNGNFNKRRRLCLT